jgi:hypothetical protein
LNPTRIWNRSREGPEASARTARICVTAWNSPFVRENDGVKRLHCPEGDEKYHYSGEYSKSENREVKKDNAIMVFREPAMEV